MIAHQLGRSVILLEKNRHPRFAIGESSTPLSNILLETLATRYKLPGIAPLSKWGTWQHTYPHIACGLKRGFTFYRHVLGAPAAPDPHHERQLLVAASPHDGIADTHWYRAEVDHFFVQQAQQIGVTYLDEVRLASVHESVDEIQIQGHRHQQDISVTAKLLIDATGPRGFLHHALKLQESPLPGYPATQALFTHFTGVARLDDERSTTDSEAPPYPIDDAAVHHVFDGGWVWILKFNNGITSAGVAATAELAERLKLAEGAPAWHRLLDQIPALRKQFANAQATRPFIHMPHMSFRTSTIAGNRWALLPSAAGFVDPLLSTGFPLTLLGVARLAEIIEQDWSTPQFSDALKTYAAQTDNELLAAARLIRSLYANMDRFPVFVSLAMLYFAAASYSETARRLGKTQLASSFLLHDYPNFGPAAQRTFEHAPNARTQDEMSQFATEISQVIAPFNVAGLADPSRQNWYSVNADDLLNSAEKVDSTEQEIKLLLEKCGFWKSAHATT